METLSSSSCQLGLGVGLSCLNYMLILELNSFIGTAHHRALPLLLSYLFWYLGDTT